MISFLIIGVILFGVFLTWVGSQMRAGVEPIKSPVRISNMQKHGNSKKGV